MLRRSRLRRKAAIRGARRRLVRRLLGLGLGIAALVPPAYGQDSDAVCGDDAARLCASSGPSRGARMRCLKEHLEELSEGCRALLGEPQQRRAEAGEACGEDAVRLCPGVQPGRTNMGLLNCLRANADSLSEECRGAIDALPGRKRDGAPPGV